MDGQCAADDHNVLVGDGSVAVDIAVFDVAGLDHVARRAIGCSVGFEHVFVTYEVEIVVVVDAVPDEADKLGCRRAYFGHVEVDLRHLPSLCHGG